MYCLKNYFEKIQKLLITNYFILLDNYDAIKNEIFKIQQTSSNKPSNSFDPFSPGPTVTSSKPESNADNHVKLDWSSAFDQNSETNSGFGVDNDPFVSFEAKKNDLFDNFTTQNTNTTFDDVWSSGSKPKMNLDSVFTNMPKSTSANTGFGLDDNWATNLTNKTSPTKTTEWTAFSDGNQFTIKKLHF